MQLIVITPQDTVKDEIETIHHLMDRGNFFLHVRKPNWSIERISAFIEQIDSKYHSRLAIHQHEQLVNKFQLGGLHLKSNQGFPLASRFRLSKSFHELKDVESIENNRLNYCFLSPIFDSISKQDYQGKGSQWDLGKIHLHCKLYALGGITPDNIGEAKEMGFIGAAVLGAIWENESIDNRVSVLDQLVDKCS